MFLELVLHSWERLEGILEYPDSLLFVFSPRNGMKFLDAKDTFSQNQIYLFPFYVHCHTVHLTFTIQQSLV